MGGDETSAPGRKFDANVSAATRDEVKKDFHLENWDNAAGILGAAYISTEALAYRGGGARAGAVHGGGGTAYHGGTYRGGAVAYRGGTYRGGVYRNGYWRPSVAAGVGATSYNYYNDIYNTGQCGYYPYPPCY